MKNFIILLNLLIILWVTSIFSVETVGDKSESEGETNKKELSSAKKLLASGLRLEGKKADTYIDSMPNPFLNEDISNFILEASQARIMDMEGGKIAVQRATSRSLKDYGSMMVKDHSRMLEELKKIAATKSTNIARSLGQSKWDELKNLKELHGKDFDDKFVRMMILDHKRDVEKFEKALYSPDPDIQVFATKYLPLIKDHLDKIKSLKKNS